MGSLKRLGGEGFILFIYFFLEEFLYAVGVHVGHGRRTCALVRTHMHVGRVKCIYSNTHTQARTHIHTSGYVYDDEEKKSLTPFIYPMESIPLPQRSNLCVHYTPEYIYKLIYSFCYEKVCSVSAWAHMRV